MRSGERTIVVNGTVLDGCGMVVLGGLGSDGWFMHLVILWGTEGEGVMGG